MHLEIIDKKAYTLLRFSGDEEPNSDSLMRSFREMTFQIDEIIQRGKYFLVFNLSDFCCLNSTMISLFVHATTKVRNNNGLVKIIVSNDNMRQILELVGVDKIAELLESENDLKGA